MKSNYKLQKDTEKKISPLLNKQMRQSANQLERYFTLAPQSHKSFSIFASHSRSLQKYCDVRMKT